MDEIFVISIKKTGPVQFTTTFDKDYYPELLFDEPKDFGGEDKYPNASKVLTAAVASCLSASFTLCLNKARIPVKSMETKAKCTLTRNNEGYLRITQIEVKLIPRWNPDITLKKKTRCIKIFKNFCIATNAVTTGVPVNVDVLVE
ncbi:MAG: OsmC family protein [Candidatus Heimdallarchaeota archaeon]|nr:MAG: OsmC family protein [Candidatus Heimdallarchaeota archaeon]